MFHPSTLPGDELAELLGRSLNSMIVVAESKILESIFQTSDLGNEVGGVLLGTAHTVANSNCFLTYVNRAVKAEGSERSAVHVRFTSQAWDAIKSVVKDTETIVGWYHTHPGLGVFMSGTDRRTQRYFFSRPWQVSLVLDPKDQEYRFFAGEESAVVNEVILLK